MIEIEKGSETCSPSISPERERSVHKWLKTSTAISQSSYDRTDGCDDDSLDMTVETEIVIQEYCTQPFVDLTLNTFRCR